MQPQLIEVMHQQVRAIHRAITGDDLPELEPATATTPGSDEDVTWRFAELAALARSMPAVAERVPPFTFTPPLDVIAGDDAVILELALCGIRREDISVERAPEGLIVRGVRRDGHAAKGRMFHAEIERGPFHRVIPLPFQMKSEPRVELEQGLLRIYVDAEVAVVGPGSRTETDENHGSEEKRK
jgi:HSP20 family molecular chaperone IbpA